MSELKPCPHCGTLGSSGCDDISLAPGQHGRSNLCFMREIAALRAEVAALKDKLTAMHRRAQDAESAAMEKAGQTHGSLGRALANAGYNQQRERADKAESEVAALKAELAKYTEPLTNTQREAVAKAMRVNNNPNLTKWDAAIRRVRGVE